MSWVTVIWSMGGGACLTLALIHIVVWWKDRTARANLVFAVMAVAVAVFAALELAMMRAETPEQWGIAVRWVHVPVWIIIASLVIFVRLYLRAGRQWLAWAVVGVRTVALILDFVLSPNINYRQITSIRHVSLLGESVSVATGVPNPWMLVAQLSLLLLVIFVVDATITVWRRGNRRQALMVGGSILLFTVAGTVEGITITWGIIPMPLTASLFYQGLVAVMAWELSYDVLHASALARQLHASEAGLRESEERFRIVADAAPVLIWMSGVDKLCTFFNKPWLEFTGRSLEQEMGNGWAEGVHPGDLQRCLKIYTEAFDARQSFVMQYRLKRHDGEYRWISDQGVARYDVQGNFTGYIGSCVDVTDLISKEGALRESEGKFRLAVEASPSGIVLVDREGKIVLVNAYAEKLFGYRREELVGKLVDVLVPERYRATHPAHRSKFLNAPKVRAMGDGRELFARRKDGSEFPVEIGLNPIETADGTLVLAAVADISARKQVELEALRHRDELGHLSRVAAMGQLAASIAHELNQPLSGITSNASAGQRFIDRGNVDLQELRDLLGDIIADGRRAGDVIRGLQSMVKKEVRVRHRVDLNDLVMNVVRMVNPNAMLQSCQLETLLQPSLPEIEADPVQLQQVLLNLIINAFDAMNDTAIGERRVVIVTERNGDGAVCTSVRDYGPGISKKVGERVFEQFFSTKARGLGMGLSIARSIIESHGGTIRAENAEGGGARFHFTLPASGPATSSI